MTNNANPQMIKIEPPQKRTIPAIVLLPHEIENIDLRGKVVRGAWLVGTNATALAVSIGACSIWPNSANVLTLGVLCAIALGAFVVGWMTSGVSLK